jgi:hypothetical protein
MNLELKLISQHVNVSLLRSSSIHLNDICLKVFLGMGIMHVVCEVRKDGDAVFFCMLHWLVGFSTLLDWLCR